MKGCVFLFAIRNPLSHCKKLREELKFKVLYGFPLAKSLEKKKIKENKRKERKRRNNKKIAGLVGIAKGFYEFQLFMFQLGMYFVDKLHWSRKDVV